MKQVILVTGGSSGIGRCTAETLAQEGHRVYALSRRGEAPAGVTGLAADVTDEAGVEATVRRIVAEAGRLDVVINAAGFGISGAVEFTDTDVARRMLEVDFFGLVNVNRAAIPVMRRQGSGRLVQVSSVAAPVPIPFQTYYSAAKAAVNAYTLALANEVRPFGLSVCAVLPGDIATGFTAAREKSPKGDDIYNGRIARSVAVMEQDVRTGMAPERVGRFIARVALQKRVKPLYTVGGAYKLVALLVKLLPCGAVNKIVGRIYAR